MSDLHIRAGDVESGQRFLDQAVSMASANSQPSLELAMHHASVAAMWRARAEMCDEIEALDDVISIIDKLMEMQENSILDQLVNSSVVPNTRAGVITKPPKRAIPTKERRKKAIPNTTAKTTSTECTPLWILRFSILVDKSMALLRNGDLKAVKAVLDIVEESRIGNSSLVKHRLAIFYKLIDQATRAISSDCTYNVLPESTISIPALSLGELKESEISPVQSAAFTTHLAVKPIARKTARGKSAKEVPDFRISIREARDLLTDVHSHAFQTSSSSEYAEVCHGIASASVFVSASNQLNRAPLVHPTQMALLLGMYHLRLLLII
jgi:separase